MAIDRKYGRVTLEHGTIAEDEPVVVFRAQDELLVKVLENYLDLCSCAGSPGRHLKAQEEQIEQIRQWQESHHTQVPRSDPH